MISLQQGYIFTCMILAAISAFLIDRKFFTAAVWSLIGAACTAIGLTHAYQLNQSKQLNGNVVDFLFVMTKPTLESARAYRSWDVAIGYLMMASAFYILGHYSRRRDDIERIAH
jgi:AGZA family xanthine/uracil permease-like MFS transporter